MQPFLGDARPALSRGGAGFFVVFFIFYGFNVNRCHIRSYDSAGRPRRPKLFAHKDLRRFSGAIIVPICKYIYSCRKLLIYMELCKVLG